LLICWVFDIIKYKKEINMNKYLINIAIELDGHAGAITAYLQTETVLTRSSILLQVVKMFEMDGYIVNFEEARASLDKGNNAAYYGDIVTTTKDSQPVDRTPISVTVSQLPKKLIKNKIYIIESRTG